MIADVVTNVVAKSPKMMPTWLNRQDFAQFPSNRHYKSSFQLKCRTCDPSVFQVCQREKYHKTGVQETQH
ncbi:hypothetical protein TNCV_1810211 [Trichonephila clavipes]|nr:hypothetical protein TNCV_1810211 [Trichonephila clavipes]